MTLQEYVELLEKELLASRADFQAEGDTFCAGRAAGLEFAIQAASELKNERKNDGRYDY